MIKTFNKIILTFGFFLFLFLPSSGRADTIISSDVIANTTWTLAGSPYIITASIYIRNNAKVTIEPGVIVKFNYGSDYFDTTFLGYLIGYNSQGQNTKTPWAS